MSNQSDAFGIILSVSGLIATAYLLQRSSTNNLSGVRWMEPGKKYIQKDRNGNINFTFYAESKLKNGNIKGKVDRGYGKPVTQTFGPTDWPLWEEAD